MINNVYFVIFQDVPVQVPVGRYTIVFIKAEQEAIVFLMLFFSKPISSPPGS